MLSWKEALLFKKMTGKPYGVYGVTYGLYGTPENEALNNAAFVYFRDTVSLDRAKEENIHCPIMEWAPDAAFGTDVTDEDKALAYLKENGLEDGKYICCNPTTGALRFGSTLSKIVLLIKRFITLRVDEGT